MRTQSERRLPFPMTIRLAMALAVFCWCAPAYAIFPHHDPLRKEIEGLEMKWRQALLTDNLGEMDRLLADDYLGISANGTLETKADVLAKGRSGGVKITQLDLNDIKIRIYGETAVVTSKADVVGTSGDRDISGRYRYTRVYTRRLGQWKIVSFEASRVAHGSRRNRGGSHAPVPLPAPIPNS